jgi:hypothetical protein
LKKNERDCGKRASGGILPGVDEAFVRTRWRFDLSQEVQDGLRLAVTVAKNFARFFCSPAKCDLRYLCVPVSNPAGTPGRNDLTSSIKANPS